MQFIDVLVTCPDSHCAETIAQACVHERLAACANIGAPVASIYRWTGAIEHANEIPVHMKTRASLFAQLSARVKALHPYETPCIIATEITDVEAGYAAWLEAETG